MKVVMNLSKVKISKAIHNNFLLTGLYIQLS